MVLFLALMETASFYAGFRHERYNVQQEIAPKNYFFKFEYT